MNIYVGNLHYGVDEEDLKRVFEQYGEVTSAKVIVDKFTGKSKGFGFIDMQDNNSAQNAIESLNDTELEGRKMRVNEARERQ